MDKGFGIAALVLAILAIFIPIVGIYVSGLALILAAIAALSGDRVYATATPLIAGVNTFFLSPSVWLVMEEASRRGQKIGFILVIVAFLAIPFVAMMLNASGKVALGGR